MLNKPTPFVIIISCLKPKFKTRFLCDDPEAYTLEILFKKILFIKPIIPFVVDSNSLDSITSEFLFLDEQYAATHAEVESHPPIINSSYFIFDNNLFSLSAFSNLFLPLSF